MPFYSTSDTIIYGKISGYLSTVNNTKKLALNGGVLDTRHPHLLLLATQSLEWLYDQDPTDEDIFAVTDYVIALCGAYLAQAINIAALGGGGTIVIPSTKTAASIEGFRIELPITQSSTPAAGATTYTVNIAGIVDGSINVESPQANLPYGVESDQLSWTISYGVSSAVITFWNIVGSTNYGLPDNLLVIITGTKFIAV